MLRDGRPPGIPVHRGKLCERSVTQDGCHAAADPLPFCHLRLRVGQPVRYRYQEFAGGSGRHFLSSLSSWPALCAARMGGSRYGLAVFGAHGRGAGGVADGPLRAGGWLFRLLGAALFLAALGKSAASRAGRDFWPLMWLAIAAMVMTKENAFFAFVGLPAALALARPLKLGTVTRETVLATFAGADLGVGLLIIIVGRPRHFYRNLPAARDQGGAHELRLRDRRRPVVSLHRRSSSDEPGRHRCPPLRPSSTCAAKTSRPFICSSWSPSATSS